MVIPGTSTKLLLTTLNITAVVSILVSGERDLTWSFLPYDLLMLFMIFKKEKPHGPTSLHPTQV